MAFKIFRKIADMLDLDETNKVSGNVIAVNDTEDGYELVSPSAAAGGAPTDAKYIVQQANADLSAEQSLGALSTGILKNTTTTGVLSIASEGTDYTKPGGTDVAITDGGTGASDAGTARTNLGLAIGSDIISKATFDDHSARHEDGGADEISIAGLSGTSAALQAHLDDTSDAHDASAISSVAAGNLSSTDVQAALNELDTEKQPLDSDLTSIAALTTTSFGRSLLTQADAAALRSTGGAAPVAAKYIVQTADSELSAEQSLGALATGILKNTTSTGVLSIATQGTDYYKPGGTVVSLADGGTGTVLSDPNADRIMFWDDSAGSITFLTPGTNLTITGTVLDAASGGGGGGDTVIFDTTLGSNTTTIDSNTILGGNISGSYTHLRLWVLARGTASSTAQILRMRLNNDSTGLYNWQKFIMNNSTTTASQGVGATTFDCGYMSAANSPSGLFQSTKIDLPFYVMSSHNRTFTAQGNLSADSSTNIFSVVASGDYASTNAITRIALSVDSGDFATGTRVILYGCN